LSVSIKFSFVFVGNGKPSRKEKVSMQAKTLSFNGNAALFETKRKKAQASFNFAPLQILLFPLLAFLIPRSYEDESLRQGIRAIMP
jgi:hypothetical protein